MNKKGQVAGIANAFSALMFSGIAIVVTVIIVAYGAKFTDGQLDDFNEAACSANTDGFTNYNVTSRLCQNATFSHASVPLTAPVNVTGDGLNSITTLSEGTGDVVDVGLITIVLTLLVGILGVFGLASARRMG